MSKPLSNNNNNINNDTFLLSATFVGCVLFSEMTIIEAHTSPLSWPSFLCSAPASSPGARPPPRPCGGQRSKGQMCQGGSREEVHTHTGNRAGAARAEWPSSNLSPAWHPVGGRCRQSGRDPAHAGVLPCM